MEMPTVVEEDGTTRTKRYEELLVAVKLQADCDLKATNIVRQGLPQDVYAIVNHHKVAKEIWDRVKLLMQGTKLSLQEKECKLNQATIQDGGVTVQQVQRRQGQSYATSSGGNNTGGLATMVKCYNCQGEGHMARQCTQPKRPRNATWFKEKAILAEAQEPEQILDKEQLAFLDLDAYDSDCDDVSNAKAILMANLSNYGSDVISKKAQWIKPTLYDGSVISSQHVASPVIDDKETLILKEVSLSKMLAKQNDPMSKEKKVNTNPINYVNLNRLSEDFGKHFVPQQELSDEQPFWLKTLHLNIEQSASSPVKIKAPKRSLQTYNCLSSAVAGTDNSPAIPEHTTVETPMNMSPKNKAHFQAEKEAIHLILTEIRDEIYSTVDACQTAQEMWEAIERLQQGESLNMQDIYKPTNNNLRTSSNLRNKNVDTNPRYKNDNQSGKFGNQRTVNVVGARENVGSPVVQQFRIQCFNCKEFRHLAKECRKPKRVKDSAYHKEKMLLCKQAEKGVPLQDEQYDWLKDTDEEINEQELEAHYNYMAKILEVPTAESGTDSEPLEQVKNDAGYNVFANDLQHSEQSESISNTCLVETDDSNVIPDSPDTEFEKYKAFNDRTIDYDKLERKLNETLRQLALKDIEINEGLKTKAYEILVVKEKHDELIKKSLLTKSHYEGLVKLKTKVITNLKLREEHDIDKMLSMEKQLNFLNEIVYKRSQSIQTIHMMAPKVSTYTGRPTFADPRYLKQAQSEILCLYAFPYDQSTHANRLIPDGEETLALERESKGKSMETKFDKPSVVRQPNAQRIPKPSVLGKPTPFSNSLERRYFPKTKSVPKTNVSEGLSKPVTAQTLPKTAGKAVSNTIVLKPGMYRIDNPTTQTRAPQSPQTVRNTNPRIKYLVDSNQFACVIKMLNDVDTRTKKPNVVPISTRKPKGHTNKSVATPHKKKVASKPTNQKPQSYFRMLYEQTSKTWKWWIEQQSPSGYKWVIKTKMQWVPKVKNENVQKKIVQLILFIVDSGFTKHMTGNLKLLCNFVEKFLGFITSKASITISSQLVNFVMRIWRLLSENLHVLLVIFRCQPMDQNIDFSGSDQIQTPQYPEIHPPSQEISDEVFQAKGDLMKSIQTFLEEFNYIPFGEKPKILLQAWDKFFAIQHAQPEDLNELFQKLLEDLRIINKELIEFAPILSTKEPEYSLSIGYEHPNTTLETESDEIIKSGVEELVPILSENEVTSEDKKECDVPVCENSPICDDHFEIFSDSNNYDDISSDDDAFEDIEYVEASLPNLEIVSVEEENDVYVEEEEFDLEEIQDVVLREKLLSINRLIANIESLNDNPTPDCVLNSSASIPTFEESDNSLSGNFSPEFETFCDHTEETRSGITTTHADDSLPEYDSFCFEIEPDQERLINVVKNDVSDNSSNDPILEEADLFLASDNSIPPGIENFAYDSKGDIHFLEGLLNDDSISFSINESSESDSDNPLFPRPPSEPPDAEFDFKPDSEEEISVVMNDNDELECLDLRDEIDVFLNNENDDYFPFMFVI
uniref:CCHC-type domain-containing protein n=1 Tax=Tanacetum cinerariifolium TaxID=118510 RepID=A0A6L2MWE8_TANCI|nr:hypothetical protein [Tanacetum cinerariifolium]